MKLFPGVSFSWRRALGVSAAKARLSRRIGVPLTRSGRQRKLGRALLRLIGLVVVLAPGVVGAQVVTTMTPALIREAIAYGAKEKKLEAYKVGGFSLTKNRPGPVATFTTPFLRVARAASEAKATYKPFAEADVTPEMIAPELQLVAAAFVPTGSKRPDSPKAVVIFAAGKPVQPDGAEVVASDFGNAMGAKFPAHDIVAHFPLALLRADSEVRVVMESGQEHKATFKLDKVR